ncbi:hypothetical protein E1A91_A10G097500v1 [Gossypium mustelinum]|uniref:Uncharacterized protein n=1 Tax=Gossypium mustelinum TaxID=34275 RepID=A0A5D2XKH7_GOSMU|nr:hypothetical protein E1A91_A10G097500v1 [Gossypium mustelinum]
MEKSKTETEWKSSSMQSPSGEKNMKDSDPVLDEDDFVIVPTSEPETKEMRETQIPKQIQTEQSPSRRKSVHWSPELVSNSPPADHGSPKPTPNRSNPYITHTPAAESSSNSFKEKMDIVKDVLGRWGKKVEEATRKAEDLAENTWQHLKTNSSFTDAAMGRIAQGTKVLAEAGPVMGVLYVSTAKLAYCSDNPLSYKNGNQTDWNFYKVVIPFHQLRAINPSSSKINPAEKKHHNSMAHCLCDTIPDGINFHQFYDVLFNHSLRAICKHLIIA